MTLSVGINSFISETDFYNHLDTRLNSDEFHYMAAVIDAGINDSYVARVFADMRGDTLENIQAALLDKGLYSDEAELTTAYATLTAGKTGIQQRNIQAIILATQMLNQFEYAGHVASTGQPLQWPRTGVYGRNRQAVASDSIPIGIKSATAELAFFLLQNDISNPERHHHIFALTSIRVGETQSTFAKRADKRLPDYVMAFLKPFLIEQSNFSSVLTP